MQKYKNTKTGQTFFVKRMGKTAVRIIGHTGKELSIKRRLFDDGLRRRVFVRC